MRAEYINNTYMCLDTVLENLNLKMCNKGIEPPHLLFDDLTTHRHCPLCYNCQLEEQQLSWVCLVIVISDLSLLLHDVHSKGIYMYIYFNHFHLT